MSLKPKILCPTHYEGTIIRMRLGSVYPTFTKSAKLSCKLDQSKITNDSGVLED